MIQKILIIDDEASVRTALSTMLRKSGYDVIVAFDGSHAAALAAATGVDLVITDVVMDGVEGIQTIVNLRKSIKKLPIIAMSGGGMVDSGSYLDLARSFGADLTLTKPFSAQELYNAIKMLSVLPDYNRVVSAVAEEV